MWACARGHKDAMLVLNQWNPLALLGLASRCSLSLVGMSTNVNHHDNDDNDDNDEKHAADTDALSSLSSSDQCRDNEPVSPSEGPVSPPEGPVSPSQCPVSPSECPVSPSECPVSSKSLFSPTELLSVDVEPRDINESELLHVEQSVTISFTDDRLTSDSKKRTTRLKKRTSVEIIPGFMQRRTNTPKISKTASVGDSVEIPAELLGSPSTWPMTVLPPGELRVSSSDSHLSGLAKLHSSAAGPDPMISMIDHDINSPPMPFSSDTAGEILVGFPMDQQPAAYILPCESMAVDVGMWSVFVTSIIFASCCQC